jgi:hypothetical protein
MLLGRITALSNTIAQATRPATTPTLARHLVHPLNPLPEHANPLAPDTFFQVLNTQPLPEVTETQKEMLEDRSRMDERPWLRWWGAYGTSWRERAPRRRG